MIYTGILRPKESFPDLNHLQLCVDTFKSKRLSCGSFMAQPPWPFKTEAKTNWFDFIPLQTFKNLRGVHLRRLSTTVLTACVFGRRAFNPYCAEAGSRTCWAQFKCLLSPKASPTQKQRISHGGILLQFVLEGLKILRQDNLPFSQNLSATTGIYS